MDSAKEQIHAFARAYAKACLGDSPPSARLFLNQIPPNQLSEADRLSVLKFIAFEEMEMRHRAGELNPVDGCLFRHSELKGDRSYVLDLIELECQLDMNAGRRVEIAGYQKRFPELKAEIARRLGPMLISEGENRPEIAGYQLGAQLGRGGMGIVYRALDAEIGRTVAIKLARPECVSDPALRRRFEEEAKITARLQHPGIPPVYRVGSPSDGQPFLAMKLVDGETLQTLLANRVVLGDELTRFIQVFEQVCQTVAFAHNQGVIHRDLKPANVMVGAFGEVQVMDWGLAKVNSPNIETPFGYPLKLGGVTEIGEVFGTPAYMPPEQANGDHARVGPWSDVFALGAMLYEILTGKPPYIDKELEAALQSAKNADLGGAWRRLEASGADADLVLLTTKCLATEPAERPKNAGEVAKAIATYRQQLDSRLAKAREDAAASKARAEEEAGRLSAERRGRKWLVGLLTALLTLVLVSSGAALWYQEHRSRQEALGRQLNKEVLAALSGAEGKLAKLRQQIDDPKASPGVAELLSEPDKWANQVRSARVEWDKADKLAQSNSELMNDSATTELGRVNDWLKREEVALALVERLDQARQKIATSNEDGKWTPHRPSSEYSAILAGAGFEIESGDEPTVAAMIQASPARPAIVSALDEWASEAPKGPLRSRILRILRLADGDSWRDQLRDEAMWSNLSKLESLAEDERAEEQSPQVLLALSRKLPRGSRSWKELLKKATSRYPRDFWLYFALGADDPDRREQIRWYQGAVAIRPLSAPVHNNLAVALGGVKDFSGAIRFYRRAIELDPKVSAVHYNLANTLEKMHKMRDAIAEYKKAIALDPKDYKHHLNLAPLLSDEGDLEGAIAHSRIGLQSLPKDEDARTIAKVHYNLANYLRQSKMPEDAIGHYRIASQFDPNLSEAYFNLAVTLTDITRYAEAIVAYKKSIELNPNDAAAHLQIGNVFWLTNSRADAIRSYRDATRLDPNSATGHFKLGMALHAVSNLLGAIEAFRTTVRLDPKNAEAHANLGAVLLDGGKASEAISHFRRALELNPNDAKVHESLGKALAQNRDLPGAIEHLNRSIKLDPNSSSAQNSLGVVFAAKKNLPEAAKHFRMATDLDKNNAEAQSNLGNVLRELNDLPGAIEQLRRAIAINPKMAAAHSSLGVAFEKSNRLLEATQEFREAIKLNPKDSKAQFHLGGVLFQMGEFEKAREESQKLKALLPASHPLQKLVQERILTCKMLLKLENKLDRFFEKQEISDEDLLPVIELCRVYKEYHATAATLYGRLFAKEPMLGLDPYQSHRFHAARSAALAAAGLGRDPKKLIDTEKAKLRAEALAWLQADLQAWRQRFEVRDSNALPGLLNGLPMWEKEEAFASVRQAQLLALLPIAEQKDWTKLWRDVGGLGKDIAAGVTTQKFVGNLIAAKTVAVHQVTLKQGEGYLVEVESLQFDTYLRVRDGRGTVLAENDDIAPGNRNSRLLVTALSDGDYRLEVSSFQAQGEGPYVLTVRFFKATKD
jgi:tetratricopeptide (TPR) repeat protein